MFFNIIGAMPYSGTAAGFRREMGWRVRPDGRYDDADENASQGPEAANASGTAVRPARRLQKIRPILPTGGYAQRVGRAAERAPRCPGLEAAERAATARRASGYLLPHLPRSAAPVPDRIPGVQVVMGGEESRQAGSPQPIHRPGHGEPACRPEGDDRVACRFRGALRPDDAAVERALPGADQEAGQRLARLDTRAGCRCSPRAWKRWAASMPARAWRPPPRCWT